MVDTPTEFTLRPVADDAELVAWGALCARGFSHRPGDPERFYKKYLADPTARREATRVVVAEDGQLVGSVRVFDRTWDVEGEAVKCAGLGEVCTDPAFRGKALHAATAVGPLYMRYGYEAVRIPYVRIPVAGLALASGSDPFESSKVSLRTADFVYDWPVYNECYLNLNRMLDTTGFTLRDEAYWTKWMPHVAGGKTVVLCAEDAGGAPATVGYACIVEKPDGWKLVDCGIADFCNSQHLARLVELAALHAIGHAGGSVILPGKVYDSIGPWVRKDAFVEAADDNGWMVRSLKELDANKALKAAAESGRLLVWQIDSF